MNLVLQTWPKCVQEGGRGSKIPKISRTYLMDGPLPPRPSPRRKQPPPLRRAMPNAAGAKKHYELSGRDGRCAADRDRLSFLLPASFAPRSLGCVTRGQFRAGVSPRSAEHRISRRFFCILAKSRSTSPPSSSLPLSSFPPPISPSPSFRSSLSERARGRNVPSQTIYTT